MLVPLIARTYRNPVSGSKDAPPQFAPPLVVGRSQVPFNEGGVKIAPERYRLISSSASCFTSGVRVLASSSVTPCGTNAGGFAGNGCVGWAFSPGTSLVVSTGRSTIGQTGLPVTRSNTKVSPR